VGYVENERRKYDEWKRHLIIWHNDERMRPYQRGRASITGLRLKLREIMATGRLVGVA
jgi:hypothetical protein